MTFKLQSKIKCYQNPATLVCLFIDYGSFCFTVDSIEFYHGVELLCSKDHRGPITHKAENMS